MTFKFAVIATLALTTALFVPKVTTAATSDWEKTLGGELRFRALAPNANGDILGLLEIKLKPGWKTYWKEPGEAGIPPQITILNSNNIASHKIHFPAPTRIDDGYSIWAGYKEPVSFPVIFKVHNNTVDTHLNIIANLGICEKICLPVRASFSLKLKARETHSVIEKFSIDSAYSKIPQPATKGFGVFSSIIDSKRREINITAAALPGDKSLENSTLFISHPDGWFLGAPTIASHQKDLIKFTAKIIRSPKTTDLSSTKFEYTFVQGNKTSISILENRYSTND